MATTTTSSGGKLNGNPPTIFTGKRSKSEKFIREFDLYWEMNITNDVMTSPWKRVFTVLSFIRGSNVDDWVDDQIKDIHDRHTMHGIAKRDKALWTQFKKSFTDAYTDLTIQQTTYRQLHQLRMEKGKLDPFIARFKHLASKANFGIDDSATKDLFAKALTAPLLLAILEKEQFQPKLQHSTIG
jgi:hypothetical protein